MYFRNFIMLCFSLIIFAGCTSNDNALHKTEDNSKWMSEQTNFSTNEELDNEQIATHLAMIASEVPLVNDATAIIAGPYAVVGIDIEDNTEKQKVGTIKYSVSEALTNDPYGRTAVIIADGDIMERIREMRESIGKGEPISGIVQELAEIVSRYMPTFPAEENQEMN